MAYQKKIIFTDRTDTIVDRYFHDIVGYEKLTEEEVGKLILQYQAGDVEAMHKIVKANLKLMVSIAKQYQGRGIELADLIQEANIGLMKTCAKFDPNKGVPFISYFVYWVRQSIMNCISDHSKTVRIPSNQVALVSKINKITSKYLQDYGIGPEPEYIAEQTGISLNQVKYMMQYTNSIMSIDKPIEGEDVCIKDVIEDSDVTPDTDTNNSMVYDMIIKKIDTLPLREGAIVKLFFGIGTKEQDSKVIADMFGMCQERVRQIKDKACKYLRSVCSDELNIFR